MHILGGIGRVRSSYWSAEEGEEKNCCTEVEDGTASGIESTKITLDKTHELGGPQHRHTCSGTEVMHASTSLCASTVKNAANPSVTTPTDFSDPLRSLKFNRCAEARVQSPTRYLPSLSRPSPAAAPDLELTCLAAQSLPASLTFHHAQDNDNYHDNRPNPPPDRITFLLLGLLFLIVGILSYILRRFLYKHYPPHILPCAVSPSSLHGWRGSDFPDHGERDEGDEYGWPSTYYSNHSGSTHSDRTSDHFKTPHSIRSSSTPPPQQPHNENGRKLHKPPMLDLFKAGVMRIMMQPHHRPGISRNDPGERDLEAGCHRHLLPPTSHTSSHLFQDSHSGRSESREVLPRYRNPFEWTPTPTPSPVPTFRRWGEGHNAEAFEMKSPLGLSRYFESDGEGILDMYMD
ncbi:hypothetical protein MMC07_003482 [Pseudocyphellaria aurata]|nr:hypothetical protein [Pseudocyphellaria aurata]